ncbi:MAG: hypothetical protein GY869_12365, partial [Planctomycetes bacterium]|nr:hypothetical protein [Planctomycetota bacterium]
LGAEGEPFSLASAGPGRHPAAFPCRTLVEDELAADRAVGFGAEIGTQALEEPEWFEKLIHDYPGKIVLGLDSRSGRIATGGWLETSEITVEEMAEKVNDWPLAAIVYTDIACDGMLNGPNFETTGVLAGNCNVPVIASGGVGSLRDIERLAVLPLMGIIVGRALYEGKFTLPEALAALDNNN